MIIIPDIHGRDFWKEAVKGHEKEEIIFLGDYVDPYSYFEDVQPFDGLRSLREVIAFKKDHPDNVTLLLGNHDLSYVTRHVFKCRHDFENHDEIRRLIQDNKQLFKIAYEKRIGNRNYIFSHAGILDGWLENNEMILGHLSQSQKVKTLNDLFQKGKLYLALGDVSACRGGDSEYGSCVWADLDEHIYGEVLGKVNKIQHSTGAFQVFGHTLQMSGRPYITDHFACLDCRHAFRLNDDGTFTII